MFTTEYNGKKYEFYNDRLTVDDIPVPYDEMSDIVHRQGDTPAFIFSYRDKRFVMPYRSEELESILPYLMKAQEIGAPEQQFGNEESEEPKEAIAEDVAQEIEDAAVLDIIPEAEDTDQYAASDAMDPETSDQFSASDLTDSDVFIADVSADDIGLNAPLKPLETGADEKKPGGASRKVIIAFVVLAVAAVVLFLAFHNKGDDSSAQDPAATQETAHAHDQDAEQKDPGSNKEKSAADEKTAKAPEPKGTKEATEGFTVTDGDGTIHAVLKKVYVGEDALKKLADMKEDPKEFTEDDPAYMTVLYEYEVEVKKGKLIGDPLSGEAYLSDKKTVLDDYWSYSLERNANKDLSSGDLTLKAGKKATGYYVYGVPSDLADYYEKVSTDTSGNTIWIHYDLK